MKNNIPLYLYGTLIIIVGIFLVLLPYTQPEIFTIKLVVGGVLINGAFLAFRTAFKRKRKQVQFAYHEIHGVAMLAYGFAVLLFCDNFEQLIQMSGLLFFYYTFSEIIFCIWLFDLGQKVYYKILFVRLILGLAIGAGAVGIMYFTPTSSSVKLAGFGVLFMIVGVNILLYVPILKSSNIQQIENGDDA